MTSGRMLLAASVVVALALPSSVAAQGRLPAACADSLYLALKARPVDSLSTREYELFRERDRVCLQSLASGGRATSSLHDSVASAEAAPLGSSDGRRAADTTGTGGWFVAGVLSGATGALLGIGVVTVAAHMSDPQARLSWHTALADAHPAYSDAFRRAYRDRLKSRRAGSAFKGGLLGTALLVGVAFGILTDPS